MGLHWKLNTHAVTTNKNSAEGDLNHVSLHYVFLRLLATRTLTLVIALANRKVCQVVQAHLVKSFWTGACPVRTLLPPSDEIWSSMLPNERLYKVRGRREAIVSTLLLSLWNSAKHLVVGLRTLRADRANSYDKLDAEQQRVMGSTRHLWIWWNPTSSWV